MRETTRTLTLPVSGTDHTFRLRKLDAFSGVRLVRLLQNTMTGETSDYLTILFHLPESDLDKLMHTCLRHADVLLPAGAIPVLSEGGWALPDLEFDIPLSLRLTQEVMRFTLEGFFPEPRPVPSGPAGSAR